MSLAKRRITDKVELVGNPDYRTIQVRYDNQVTDSGVVISSGNYERIALEPGTLLNDVYIRTSLNDFDTEVRNHASTSWTEASYTAHEAYLRAQA